MGCFKDVWESAKLILGCLGESQGQSKGEIKIDAGRTGMRKWRRESIKEVSCTVKLLSVFFVRLCPVAGHHSVSYLLVKLN